MNVVYYTGCHCCRCTSVDAYAAAMINTENNININPNVKLTLGSRNVMGYRYMGTGFLLEGTARFLKEGDHFKMMKDKYPFLTRVLEVTVSACKQTL